MRKAIVVMSRVPFAGKTKTRLMAKLPGFECAAFHRACLEDICMAVNRYDAAGYMYLDGDFNAEYFGNMQIRQQTGNDLGEKLYHACTEVLSEYEVVLLLGADMPLIDDTFLTKALLELVHNDVVIGPAADGGYYLLGVKKAHKELFVGIPWGGPDVCNITIQKTATLGLMCSVLCTKRDIDTWDDLVSFQDLNGFVYAKTQGRALAEAKRLVREYKSE